MTSRIAELLLEKRINDGTFVVAPTPSTSYEESFSLSSSSSTSTSDSSLDYSTDND